MRIIDTHCDTLTKIYKRKENLFSNNLHIDIKRMQKYEGYAQFFACFISPENKYRAKEYALDGFYFFNKQLEQNKKHIALARDYEEYNCIIKSGKSVAFFSIEGGEAIEALDDVDLFYDLGVRMVTLTWNYDNEIASGVLGDKKRGVTEYGKKVINKMNEKKILTDVSHLNEKSFWDVAEISKMPIIASHSNAYSVCKNDRNLKDNQIEQIKVNGGYIGINLYPPFLKGDGEAKISDILKHIEYFLSLGCENIIGLGSDFDGVDCLPAGITGSESIETLFNEMSKIGYSDSIIEKIAYKNCEKIIKLL